MLDRLDLRGDETVLDAGCGSGRVTRLLAERLPRGRVIAVDASAQMVARAREELGPRADVRGPTSTALRLDDGEQVDAVFSNAAFHWVADHDALFAALAAAMRPGGRISAQCGGAGNVAAVHEQALAAAPTRASSTASRAGRAVELRRARARPSAARRGGLRTRPVLAAAMARRARRAAGVPGDGLPRPASRAAGAQTSTSASSTP